MSSEITYSRVLTLSNDGEGNISCFVKARNSRTLRSQRPAACVDAVRRNSGGPKVNQCPVPALVRQEKAYCRQSCMYGLGKSDDLIVLLKHLNNGVCPPAEGVEGRGSAKGNADKGNTGRSCPRTGHSAGRSCRVVLHVYGKQLNALPSRPEAGAVCVSSARTDLCRGCPVTGIPTASN